MNALLLAGHGSHISPHTAGLVWSYVDRLRALGIADEVGACFWKEAPAFSQVLDSFCSDTVIVVPALAADGYFARTVIPAEMGLSGPLTCRGTKCIHYTQPLGLHPRLGDVLHNCVSDLMIEQGLDTCDVAVAVIGHGTRRDARSQGAARIQAQSLERSWPGLTVLEAYLDDEPSIASIYERTGAPVILAAPWFLAPGSHVSVDVPRELGLPSGASSGRAGGRFVYYLGATGTADVVCEVILELARTCGPDLKVGRPASVWSGFPRRGAQALWNEVCEQGRLQFGELLLTPTEVRPVAEDAEVRCVCSPAELRSIVREQPFRPLPEATGLPAGWRVALRQPHELAAVVETIYPGAVADWAAWRKGAFQPESLAAVAARQTGNYRAVDELPAAIVAQVSATLCDNCVRQPTWNGVGTATDELPCRSPCNLWLSKATMEIA
jgi:sirohydrochlorin cobaltochelatase